MSIASTSALFAPETDVEPLRQRLGEELRRLRLPPPTMVLHPGPAGAVLSARLYAADAAVHILQPVTSPAAPAELAARIELPAPASLAHGPQGWRPHPDQADDAIALAFRDRLDEASTLLPPGFGDPLAEWDVQIVADAADSCLFVLRGGVEGRPGAPSAVSIFLDLLPRVRHLIRGWTRPYALPAGPVAECLATQDLPVGEAYEVDWRLEEGFVLVPDSLVEEEEEEDRPTELDELRPLVNLAELELLEPAETEWVERPGYEDPVVEIEDSAEDDADEEGGARSVDPMDQAIGEEEAPTQVEEPPTVVDDPVVEAAAPASSSPAVPRPAASSPGLIARILAWWRGLWR